MVPGDRSFVEGEEVDELSRLIVERIEAYQRDLDGCLGLPLYEMIVMAAERPLLKWAMEKSGGSQKAASRLLGIHRNTLHRKLVSHGMLDEL